MTAMPQPLPEPFQPERLHAALVPHKVEWKWVRGHQGHVENERVDVLARQALRHALHDAAEQALFTDALRDALDPRAKIRLEH